MNTYRKASKLEFGCEEQNRTSHREMEIGCLQRIADASEKMAQSYTSLESNRDMYKRWYEDERIRKEHYIKSNAALRGHITRLKKQLEAARGAS